LPKWASLPGGPWYVSDWAGTILEKVAPTVSHAAHVASGARFGLLSAGDQILGLSPEDGIAKHVLAGALADPSKWANLQRWRIELTKPAPRKVVMDPEQLASLGITEEIAIELPENFDSHMPEQRRAWCRAQIEATMMEMFEDIAQAYGAVPTPAQRAAFLQRIQPGIDQSLEGST
jgi:hypothetical protein